MLKISLLPITELLQNAVSWHASKDSVFTAFLDNTEDPYGPYLYHDVSRAQLQQAHPLLPDFLLALRRSMNSDGEPVSIEGNTLLRTLAVWRGDYLSVVDTVGSECRLTDIFSMEEDEERAEFRIRAYTVETEAVRVNDVDMEYVVWRANFHDRVKKAVLDERYPGWETPWRVGLDLGTPLEELVAGVFFRKELDTSLSLPSDMDFN